MLRSKPGATGANSDSKFLPQGRNGAGVDAGLKHGQEAEAIAMSRLEPAFGLPRFFPVFRWGLFVVRSNVIAPAFAFASACRICASRPLSMKLPKTSDSIGGAFTGTYDGSFFGFWEF